MKIQHFAIIFIIIVLPISFLLNSYIQSHIDIVSTKTSYDSKISDAMYDAVKAYELNTSGDNISNNRSKEVQSAISTFYNSLGTNLSYTGYGKNQLQSYTPATVFTLYDGYYVYSKYKNSQTNQYEYQLNPYSYYSCRYVKGDDYDFVVNYTLDNYITIYGKVNGSFEKKSGYLIDIDKIGQTTKSLLNIGRYDLINTFEWDGAEVGKENLSEYLVILDKGELTEKRYNYKFYNGEKIYKDDSDTYFKYTNNIKTDITDASIISYLNNSMESTDAIDYYITSYNFTKWVNDNLSTITPKDSVDANTGKTIEFDLHEGIKNECIFKTNTTNNDPEKKDSIFFMHKQSVIRNQIEKHLEYVIANYNYNTSLTYSFALPNIKETDWDKIINNVAMLTFVQGLTVKDTYYNHYCVMVSNSNKDFITENNIRICTDDGTYHKLGCKTMIDKSVNNDNTLTMAILEKDTKRQELVLSKENKIYYYKNRKDENTAYTNCYDCIVNASDSYNIQDIINGQITNENGEVKYTKDNLKKVRSLYFTTIAREKYQIRKFEN